MNKKEKIIEKVSEIDFDISSIRSLTVGIKGVGVFIVAVRAACIIVRLRNHLRNWVKSIKSFLLEIIKKYI